MLNINPGIIFKSEDSMEPFGEQLCSFVSEQKLSISLRLPLIITLDSSFLFTEQNRLFTIHPVFGILCNHALYCIMIQVYDQMIKV